MAKSTGPTKVGHTGQSLKGADERQANRQQTVISLKEFHGPVSLEVMDLRHLQGSSAYEIVLSLLN